MTDNRLFLFESPDVCRKLHSASSRARKGGVVAGVLFALSLPGTALAQSAAADLDRADRERPGLATSSDAGPTPAQSSPALFVSPSLELQVGEYLAPAAGGSVTLALTENLHVGVFGARTTGITNSMEGCSTTEYCYRSAWWAGGVAEWHFRPTRTLNPWIGMDVARYAYERLAIENGIAVQDDGAKIDVSPRAGLDVNLVSGRVGAALGLYGGVTSATGGALVGTRLSMSF